MKLEKVEKAEHFMTSQFLTSTKKKKLYEEFLKKEEVEFVVG